MFKVNDVAAYILRKRGTVTTWKLQKLVYYSQAWSLVWDERPLFRAKIEAWANGPVSPHLYNEHRGQFNISNIDGNPDNLDSTAKETINAVLDYYGEKPPHWLSDLTHIEAPWRNARGSLPDGARSGAEITLESMAEYYGSLGPGS